MLKGLTFLVCCRACFLSVVEHFLPPLGLVSTSNAWNAALLQTFNRLPSSSIDIAPAVPAFRPTFALVAW